MFCHTKPNVTQTNFHKLHPKLHPYQHEVDRWSASWRSRSRSRAREQFRKPRSPSLGSPRVKTKFHALMLNTRSFVSTRRACGHGAACRSLEGCRFLHKRASQLRGAPRVHLIDEQRASGDSVVRAATRLRGEAASLCRGQVPLEHGVDHGKQGDQHHGLQHAPHGRVGEEIVQQHFL